MSRHTSQSSNPYPYQNQQAVTSSSSFQDPKTLEALQGGPSAGSGSSSTSYDRRPSPSGVGSGVGVGVGVGVGQGQPSGSASYTTSTPMAGRTVSSSRTPTGALDSNITRLLVTTKHMLQGLESWSQGTLDEEGVSDIYVKLGNGFETCITAFQRAGISTSELDSIPADLRVCLEQCLAEDPSQETLNLYLPNIRTIIYGLLNGLKQKQAAYKRIMNNRTDQSFSPSQSRQNLSQMSGPSPQQYPQQPQAQQPQAQQQAQQRSHLPTHTRPQLREDVSEARLSARSNTSMSQGSASPASIHSPLPSGRTLADRPKPTGTQGRPPPPDAFRPTRMRAPDGSSMRSASPNIPPMGAPNELGLQNSTPPPGNDQPQLIRHQLSDPPVPVAPSTPNLSSSQREAQAAQSGGSSGGSGSIPPRRGSGPTPPPKPTPPRPDRFSRDSFGNPRAISRFSADSDITNGSPIRSPPRHSPAKRMSSLDETAELPPPPPPLPPSLPPSLPTLNLPTSSIHLSDPPQPELQAAPQMADVPPESRATLAALSRSDALERRASKRFSSYTFNKLPGSPTQKKGSALGGSPQQRPARRMDKAPPLPALPETLPSKNLAPSTSGEDHKSPSPSSSSRLGLPNGSSNEESDSISPLSGSVDLSNSDQEDSVRSFKTPEPLDASPQFTPRAADDRAQTSTSRPGSTSLTVFLQVGRQVKKTNLEVPVSLSALRLMFMERFEYDPGMEDFPDVYVRDSRTGVQYELEDTEDLRDGSLLSLNIEPLDQVKQHFDITFANLMQEMKEMKKSIEQQRRQSIAPVPNAALLALSPSTHTPRALPNAMPGRSPEPPRPSSPLPVRSTSAAGPVRTEDLRAQHDEVQSLRRDLAVMRQVHVDFFTESKEALAKLRKENSSMRDLVKTKMGGSRALLDNSKAKLESLCADTIQAVEEISDTIDSAREDAFKRFVTPSTKHMATIRSDLRKAHDMVDAFAKEVSTVEPTWRATWHQELSRVMEEQRLLPHQSKLTVDLKNDIKDAETMLQNLQDFVDQRAASQGRNPSRGFRPPTPDESGGIPNLLMEIRTKESDPNQRLKAIEAQQKAREKEKANKTDEFEQELSGFVKGRKLRKTGGTEETERKTQRRQDQALKRMLTGENPPNGPGQGGGGGGGAGGSGAGSPISGILSPQITGRSGYLSPQFTGKSLAEEQQQQAAAGDK